MLSYLWLLCYLSSTLLLHALPVPSRLPSALVTSISTPISITTPSAPSASTEQRVSNTASGLFKAAASTTSPGFNLFPPLPPIPNVFIPITSMNNAIPEAPQTIPTIVPIDISNPGPNKGLIGIPIYPSDGFSDVPALIAACQSDRSPLLPANFELEVGIVRLFRQSSYRDEIAVVKGCGCVTLQTPIIVESFVGSQNHSFAFYTGKHCEKEPFYQRFNQHYDIDPNKVVNSIRIFQGVLPPLPSSDTLQ